MMNYEIFKEVVAEKFLSYMPKKYQGMSVEIHPVNKVNRVMDGFCLKGTEPGTSISPTMYINDMYEHYTKSENLQEVLENAAKAMEKAFEEMPPIPNIDVNEAKDKIVFQIVNTVQNADMLKNTPHREFQDLSIIYRWMIDSDSRGISSTVIRNNLAEQMGLSEDQLFKLAVENTKRLLPPTIRSMNDVMKDIFAKDGMPLDMIDMMIGDMPANQQMYVISNEKGINGAVSMLYEDGLHDLSMKLESDLYILPSSVHEVIAVSVEMGDPEYLAQMVNEINMDQVALDERLSNQVYHYDKDLRKLSLATDTPNKRLDGIVAEPKLIYEAGKTR